MNTNQETVRLMTLNIVHATRIPLPPRLVARRFIERQLDAIAGVVSRSAADIVALQEADGDARIDRAKAIAVHARLTCVHDASVHSLTSPRHGAALLTRGAPLLSESVVFARARFDDKGFVRATLRTTFCGDIDVVSVHLDAFRASVRHEQIDMLASHLGASRQRPLIVMGDLNSGWDAAAGDLARTLGLRSPAPLNHERTHAIGGRIDWILVSSDLDVGAYRVISDGVSDHRAVIAEVGLASVSHGARRPSSARETEFVVPA